jgi:hypothetical protein
MMNSDALSSASFLMRLDSPTIVYHLRKNMIQYLGTLQLHPLMSMIRAHLDRNYCDVCGEYIYNPFFDRRIRHFHSKRYRKRYIPLLQQRLRFYNHHMMVEFERRFPRVMRLPLEEDEEDEDTPLFQRAARIPALQLWTLEEWNLLYPSLACNLHSSRIPHTITPIESSLFIPTMNFVRESELVTLAKDKSFQI